VREWGAEPHKHGIFFSLSLFFCAFLLKRKGGNHSLQSLQLFAFFSVTDYFEVLKAGIFATRFSLFDKKVP
jgi:hypothetical protein